MAKPRKKVPITIRFALAAIAHEIVRLYQRLAYDEWTPPFVNADAERRRQADAIAGFFLASGGEATLEELHAFVRDDLISNGWTYGPVYSLELRQTPLLRGGLWDLPTYRLNWFRALLIGLRSAYAAALLAERSKTSHNRMRDRR